MSRKIDCVKEFMSDPSVSLVYANMCQSGKTTLVDVRDGPRGPVAMAT